MSYSSRMSPTITSRMSSSVTMPLTPPNSSMTTAMCRRRARISRSTLETPCSLGDEIDRRAHQIAERRALELVVLEQAKEVFGVEQADDVVDLLAIDRESRMALGGDETQHFGSGVSISMAQTWVRGTITSRAMRSFSSSTLRIISAGSSAERARLLPSVTTHSTSVSVRRASRGASGPSWREASRPITESGRRAGPPAARGGA